MKKNTRDRLVLPILIPVLGLAFIALVTILMSRVLLAIPAEGATFVALLVAVVVLVSGALVARGRKVAAGSLALMVVATLGMAAFAGGVVLAAAGPRKAEVQDEPVKGFDVNIVAKNIAFDPTEVPGVPVGENVLINFDNQDAGTQHNIEVFGNAEGGGDPIYSGEIITGPAKIQYTLQPFDKAGSYYFQCVIHPNMKGDLVVGEAKPTKPEKPGTGGSGSPAPGGPAPTEPAAAPIDLTAPVGAVTAGFTETSLTAPADTPFTVHFDNQDAGNIHNMTIYEGTSNTGKEVFSPPDNAGVTGPGTEDYKIPPLKAGTYFYACFFHPTTMTGTLTVQ